MYVCVLCGTCTACIIRSMIQIGWFYWVPHYKTDHKPHGTNNKQGLYTQILDYNIGYAYTKRAYIHTYYKIQHNDIPNNKNTPNTICILNIICKCICNTEIESVFECV